MNLFLRPVKLNRRIRIALLFLRTRVELAGQESPPHMFK